MSKTSEDSIRCSFCGREKKEVNVLIAGITGHICDSCITQAHLIVKEEGGIKSKNEIENTKSLNFLNKEYIKSITILTENGDRERVLFRWINQKWWELIF